MRWFILVCLSISSFVIFAADVKPEADKTKAEVNVLEQLLEEQKKWTFEPPAGRQDVFYDLEDLRRAQKSLTTDASAQAANTSRPGIDREKTLDWARNELARVEGFVLVRKWEDAIRVCESTIKTLAKSADDDAFVQMTERFKRYRTQAEEAKIYEEAQAKFDALGLKIEGILWSATSSMAIVGGETRALKLNDRVKDCVIINIDTNRVDFLFHYNRRRFEFQRYVGEDVKAGDAKTPSRKR